MKFCIRVDDVGFSAVPADEAPLKVPDAGLELARRFHVAMNGLPYLGAVVPACVDPEGLAWLQSEPKGLTIAAHGYDHRRKLDVDCEFHDLDPDGYRDLLERAWNRLPIWTPHYVAPFNSYPVGLFPVLAAFGYDVQWTGPEDTSRPPRPIETESGVQVPAWRPTYGATLWRMGPDDRALVDVLPSLLDQPGQAVICLHIPWEAAKSAALVGVLRLVELIGDRVVSPDEYISCGDPA